MSRIKNVDWTRVEKFTKNFIEGKTYEIDQKKLEININYCSYRQIVCANKYRIQHKTFPNLGKIKTVGDVYENKLIRILMKANEINYTSLNATFITMFIKK